MADTDSSEQNPTNMLDNTDQGPLRAPEFADIPLYYAPSSP